MSGEGRDGGWMAGTAQEKVAALSVLQSHTIEGERLEEVVRAIEDDDAYEEESYDWSGPAGYTYSVRVGDRAAEIVERVGVRAVEALARAVASGASARTLDVLWKIVAGSEQRLRDETLAVVRASVDGRDGVGVRLARRLAWEARRRAGEAAEAAHVDALCALLDRGDANDRADAVWGLSLAKGSRRAAERLLAAAPAPGVGPSLASVGPVLDEAGLSRLIALIGPPDGHPALFDAAAQYDDARVGVALAGWVAGPSAVARQKAALLLRDAGGAPSAARDDLMTVVLRGTDAQRTWAWIALGAAEALGGEERARFVSHVRDELAQEGASAVPGRAAQIAELGAAAAALAPALAGIVCDRGAPVSVRLPAVTALAAMGEAARPFVPRIAALLEGTVAAELHTLRALERLGPIAADAAPAVERYLARGTGDERRRAAAEAALVAIRG